MGNKKKLITVLNSVQITVTAVLAVVLLMSFETFDFINNNISIWMVSLLKNHVVLSISVLLFLCLLIVLSTIFKESVKDASDEDRINLLANETTQLYEEINKMYVEIKDQNFSTQKISLESRLKATKENQENLHIVKEQNSNLLHALDKALYTSTSASNKLLKISNGYVNGQELTEAYKKYEDVYLKSNLR